MNSDRNIDSYKRFYVDINFDRAGLFEILKKEYGCSTVLYPGCSIHITPSFYFQHVVYVDFSKMAKEFFDDIHNILNYINSNKKYKQSAYVQFIHGDYTKPLPVREVNFDLLIALYADGITQSCKKYVKPGGIILTNNHHGDAEELLKDCTITIDGLIYKKGKKYIIEKDVNDDFADIIKRHRKTKKDMKNTAKGLEYVDNQCYCVLKKNK
ncbi:MAG TPA: class I SAM-dependent methyltransferase [Clostridiaceae bacterium]|nr:class I SAM-dependent methyltransferase [Clostridiaceae bacterium]